MKGEVSLRGFRVWDIVNKRMYYDDFIVGTDGELYKLVSYTNINDEEFIANIIPVNNNNYIVMRKSIFLDKCNRPIYELDIFKDHNGNEYKIKYNDEKGFYAENEKKECFDLDNLKECDFLGNVFDL